mmetsp:Transcript_82799/g.210729  ORF Transcript_82799/g.210729 Transcript_82799/m.210729 type:complete len:315 (-) Transcript_82799:487-1431(-)
MERRRRCEGAGAGAGAGAGGRAERQRERRVPKGGAALDQADLLRQHGGHASAEAALDCFGCSECCLCCHEHRGGGDVLGEVGQEIGRGPRHPGVGGLPQRQADDHLHFGGHRLPRLLPLRTRWPTNLHRGRRPVPRLRNLQGFGEQEGRSTVDAVLADLLGRVRHDHERRVRDVLCHRDAPLLLPHEARLPHVPDVSFVWWRCRHLPLGHRPHICKPPREHRLRLGRVQGSSQAGRQWRGARRLGRGIGHGPGSPGSGDQLLEARHLHGSAGHRGLDYAVLGGGYRGGLQGPVCDAPQAATCFHGAGHACFGGG